MQERTSLIGPVPAPAQLYLDVDTLAVVSASRGVRDTLGLADGRLREMSLTDLVVQPASADLRNLLLSLTEAGAEEMSIDAALRDAEGNLVPAGLLVSRIPSADGARLSVAVNFATSSFDDRPQLTPANPTFVEFASRLGHDLNNLLSTVIGSLGLLREDDAGPANQEDRQLVEDALSAGRECADLVDRLMAAAGKQLLRPQRARVNDIIERLTPLLEQTLPDNVELRVSLEPELPELWVDPDRLEAALIDLVLNAREAMPSGGVLTIETCIGAGTGAQPPLAPDRAYVQISVGDAGSGIPEELRRRVLEPLFSTKSSGAGRGLGLSMANGFVQQSHGGLGIVTGPDRGTRVTLFLPPASS